MIMVKVMRLMEIIKMDEYRSYNEDNGKTVEDVVSFTGHQKIVIPLSHTFKETQIHPHLITHTLPFLSPPSSQSLFILPLPTPLLLLPNPSSFSHSLPFSSFLPAPLHSPSRPSLSPPSSKPLFILPLPSFSSNLPVLLSSSPLSLLLLLFIDPLKPKRVSSASSCHTKSTVLILVYKG